MTPANPQINAIKDRISNTYIPYLRHHGCNIDNEFDVLSLSSSVDNLSEQDVLLAVNCFEGNTGIPLNTDLLETVLKRIELRLVSLSNFYRRDLKNQYRC